jgi:hypothetical protein
LAAAVKGNANEKDGKKSEGEEGVTGDGKMIEGWDGGVGGDGGVGKPQIKVAATGAGVSPRRRVNKREKDDTSVGSKRKPAPKLAKGSVTISSVGW